MRRGDHPDRRRNAAVAPAARETAWSTDALTEGKRVRLTVFAAALI
jgi:hypothetical protein